MERYEHISIVGEGSYGVVMKCRHRDSDTIVAVKKFLETEEDPNVRKMALREIRMLKKLKHENLVTMIDVFRYRKRFFLVFEYLSGTVLDEIEKQNGGLGEEKSRDRIYQVLRALAYCHSIHIVHRDIKPENVLISSLGVVKLCDFGFARVIANVQEPCTEYVATRWYRAPELLVGEPQYGSSIDIWATGCLFAEMITGEPLFPGESDIDQLYLIMKAVGKPCARHQAIMAKNSHLRGMAKSTSQSEFSGLQKMCSTWTSLSIEFLFSCLQMDPTMRGTCSELLKHSYFVHDNFPQRFLPVLRDKVNSEFNSNPLLRKFKADVLISTDRRKHQDEGTASRHTSQSSNINDHRWKINLTDGSIKRKFSCDSDFNFPGRKSYREKTGLTFLKSTKTLNSVNEIDVSSLSKSIENITARSDQEQDNSITSSSMFNFPQNCDPKAMLKSPKLLQNKLQPSVKSIFSQNLNTIPISTKNMTYTTTASKKLERHSIHDLFINIEPLHLGPSAQLNSNGKKKSKIKDDFTLPNLPGATISPKESKMNKINVTPESSVSILTPRILSASDSSKNILPLM